MVDVSSGAEVTVSWSGVGGGSVGAGSGSVEVGAAGGRPGSAVSGGVSTADVGLASSETGAAGVAAKRDKARPAPTPMRIHLETHARKDFWAMIIPPDDPRHWDDGARMGRALDAVSD
jgi:hypothetical protein